MPTNTISTIERVLDVLDLFSEECPAISVATVAEKLGRPRSTAYRHMEVLKDAGLIEERGGGGVYRPGLKLLILARLVRRNMTAMEAILGIMRQLAKETEESVVLTVPFGLHGVYLEEIESPHALHLTHGRGSLAPLHAGASGKALLAFMGEDSIEKLISQGLQTYSAQTITQPDKLREHLAEIRAQGYAISTQEWHPRIRGIAAPIFAAGGNVVASIGASGPSHRLAMVKLQAMAPLVVDAARRVQNSGWF